ncbi:phytanoyl-CoA dioxygenase family protein [Amycolatopsis sp. cg5]|uniref:phytanoyl-CoA dioxygenase family protein n=1 Tax=Amycolatopsis sp. cg5 TaxID=3238802 RepID=UPI003524A7C4
MGSIPRFGRPCSPDEIDKSVLKEGAVIVEGAYSPEQCETFLAEVDAYVRDNPGEAKYADSSILGTFQGPTTSSLHSLVGAIPSAASMVLQEDILGCARRVLAPLSDTILLSVAEYMARHPGQELQGLHRDTFSWRHVPVGEQPIALTVMAAMRDFTPENGATWVVPGSYGGPATDPAPEWSEAIQAELKQGDALLFRADLFHGGGANTTESDVRHIFSMGFQVAWLRTVENSTLSVPPSIARDLPVELQELLGYSNEMVLGLYKGGDPKNALT